MPQPQFESRAIFRTRRSLQQASPYTPKQIYFKRPHLLENSVGHRFELIMCKHSSFPRYEAFLVRKGSSPASGAYMKFTIFPRTDEVHIGSLHSSDSLYSLETTDYCEPPPERRGYGYIRVAIFLAAHLAKMHGINRLTIKPASTGLSNYYESHGFEPHYSPRSRAMWGHMVLPLKATSPF